MVKSFIGCLENSFGDSSKTKALDKAIRAPNHPLAHNQVVIFHKLFDRLARIFYAAGRSDDPMKHPLHELQKQYPFLKGYNQKKLLQAQKIDKALNLLFGKLISQEPPQPDQPIKKILVLQSHLVGDVIMSTPVFKNLRAQFPNAQITLLANPFAKELLKNCPDIDNIKTMKFPWATYDYSLKNLLNVMTTIRELRQQRFDLAIDAQIDMRNLFLMFLTGAKRRLGYGITGGSIFINDNPPLPKGATNLLDVRLALLKSLGIENLDNRTQLTASSQSQETIQTFLHHHGIQPTQLVVIHPGASKKEKLWPPAHFADVIATFTQNNYSPVLIQGPQDQSIVKQILALTPSSPPVFQGSLDEVVALITKARLVLCMDSAAVHISGATGTPCIALYGPKWPFLTKPDFSHIHALWDQTLDCRPCEYGHCVHKENLCMTQIAAQDVIAKSQQILETVWT